MKRLFSGFACFSLVLVLMACGNSPAMLDRVLVKNATDSRITEIKVYHEPTKRYGAVNAILPDKSLDIAFSGQPMLARKATVSWRDGDDLEWSLTVELPYDQTLGRKGPPMSLIYIIYPSGRVDVHLRESIKIK
jgi:hypothetical protein